MPRIALSWREALVWLGPVLLLLGTVRHRMWDVLPWDRFVESLLIGAAAWALAWVAARLSRTRVATWLAAIWCLALVVFAGPVPVLAGLLLALAALALGGVVGARGSATGLQAGLGLVLIAGTLGWLLPLPVHHRWLYLALVAALLAWRREALRDALRASREGWSSVVGGSPRLAALALLAIGMAAGGTWLPTLQFDDLAYHLYLPWQLQLEGAYGLDPARHVWALAPWASDVLHAFAQVLADAEARGPVNALWLAIAAAGLWRLAAHLGGDVSVRWLCVMLFASLPMTAMLAGGMQTELPCTALLAWMAALIAGPRDGSPRFWIAIAILAGGLAALKLMAAVMGLLLLAWALQRHPRPTLRVLLPCLLLGLLIAGSSYTYAAVVAGNPFLPLFNGWFKSDYFAHANFADPRWHAGFGPTLPWRITFDTPTYSEAAKGAAGFTMLGLAGAWLLALGRPSLRVACIALSLVALAPLLPMQYARYAYPGLVLLAVPCLLAAREGAARTATVVAIGLALANVAFLGNSLHILRHGAIAQTVTVAGADAPLFERYAPERLLLSRIRDEAPGDGVLVLDAGAPYSAELASRGRTASWYEPGLQRAVMSASADASGRAWSRLLDREGIVHVVLRPAHGADALVRALAERGAVHRQTVGDLEWWSLPSPDAADGAAACNAGARPCP